MRKDSMDYSEDTQHVQRRKEAACSSGAFRPVGFAVTAGLSQYTGTIYIIQGYTGRSTTYIV